VPATPPISKAHTLGPDGRKKIALRVLAGGRPTQVAREHDVSRKFVYGQVAVAKDAIQSAFADNSKDDDHVLFHVAVTKSLVRQIVLALLLRCHSSYRGVIAFLLDIFGHSISLGTVHNIVAEAIPKAEAINKSISLAPIKGGLNDEIYQSGKPVLVGVDPRSTFCYLLAAADHADGETWGCHLLDAMAQGLSLDFVVADLGSGLRRGQELVMPNVPCYADIFHMFRDMSDLVRYYQRELDGSITARRTLDDKMAMRELKGKDRRGLSAPLGRARGRELALTELVNAITILFDWVQHDVLALAGAGYEDRSIMFDFIIAELKALETGREKLMSLRKRLENHKVELLGFVKAIDEKLDQIAVAHKVPKHLLESLCAVLGMSEYDARRYEAETKLRRLLGGQFHQLQTVVAGMLAQTVRASSLVEMTNSLLRNYFFLRRQAGAEYLKLLQFYLNHRVLVASEQPVRVGKSPRHVMTGQDHAHWLELLGFQRLARCA
jgi:hypothetical protein